MNLLEIRNLSVTYRSGTDEVRAVDGIDLDVNTGEVVGLAGESGCGKSTLALAVAQLLPPGAQLSADRMRLGETDLLTVDDEGLRRLRWNRMSMVFQGAMNGFNPVMTVGAQIAEAIRTHRPHTGKREIRARVAELLGEVGIAPGRAADYPHQFSGGMKQRAMIAMALACDPELVIADEPTTALDVMTQAQILELIRRLADELDLAMLVISHDLMVLGELCDRAAVMYAGRIVERGRADEVFTHKAATGPAHPYTRQLLACFPRPGAGSQSIIGIAGSPPDLAHPPDGCRFRDRCEVALHACATDDPALHSVGQDATHLAACHRVAVQARIPLEVAR
ncbi:ABC transporter ATP-binding protein [Mycolicibacterium septicum]|uniref:ABC transporter ATP-binding protein n=1 Tax=Mycolicibacterium septicum TaxID=98668 RepID=UPI0023E266F3|nr:ABC transporter ATP-binding protein [Mycolicibacterium septicum]MDF3338862.1 ABC transporter ATP-binding protein [Mycolicibacterium septicum]